MKDRLPISVILPVHNGARFVADALRSVIREPVSELIVVDDGSTDGTAALCESFFDVSPDTHALERLNIHVLREQRGVGYARNFALRDASYPWLAFIDADDVWMPGKTQKQWDALSPVSRVGTTVSRDRIYAASLVDHFMDIGYEIPATLRDDKLGIIELCFPSNLLCHRSVFEYVGGFDPDLVCANDVDWFHRALKLGVGRVTVPEVLVRKRVHDANLSLCQGHDMQRQIFQSLKRKVEPGMFPIWEKNT